MSRMRRLHLLLFFVSLAAVCFFLYIYYELNTVNANKFYIKEAPVKSLGTATSLASLRKPDRIVISFVVCDSKLNESLNVVKSALLFTKTPLYFIIFTEDNLRPMFEEILNKWKVLTDNQLGFELHRIRFPGAKEEEWLSLFKKCAAQRLFIPALLPHIDAMIYVDIDTIFLGPVDELWHYFSQFNSSHLSALAIENDNINVSWYPRFARHPFYGKYGLNSGVMVMNLTRMRDFGWVDYLPPIMKKWKQDIPWGDQDIINIIFHYHPGSVFVLSCRYNYRTDQCMFGDACAAASERGVFLLHGSRLAFHSHKHPAFEAVHRAINEYEIGTNPMKFVTNMATYLSEVPESTCATLKDSFLKLPLQVLTNHLP